MLSEWASISSASGLDSLNVRRATPDHPLDFRIGRDFKGRFVFQLEVVVGEVVDRKLPSPAGIEVVREAPGDGRTRLTLILANSADFEIFRVLCADLLLATESLAAGEGARSVSLVLDRLARWQEILARRRAGILGRNEIIGLVGELHFLRDILLSRMHPEAAIAAWRGPFGDEQDFAIAEVIFEVKTQISTADRCILVSSADQLDTSRTRIILCHQILTPTLSDDPGGRTLNSLVAELRSFLRDRGGHALDRFEVALFEAGWLARSEYDEDSWKLVDRVFYEVREGFPRITRASLCPGVNEVRYSIQTAHCSAFKVDIEFTMTELTGR